MKGVKRNINYGKIKWFCVWFVIFLGLIWISEIILSQLRESFGFFGHVLVYFIFVGFMLAFFSRLISSAIWSKHFVFDSQIFYWTLIFACALWFVRFITFLKRTSFGDKNRKKIKIL